MRILCSLLSLFCLPVAATLAVAAPPKLPHAEPEAVGMDSAKLAEIDSLIAAAMEEKQLPGCVLMISRQGKIIWLKPYGHRQVEPEVIPMTTDAVFDLASITKPVSTATSIMLLAEQGKLNLDDPVAKYWPEFGTKGKEQITIRQLLTHQGGLIPDNALRDYEDGPELAFPRIASLGLQAAPGERFIYSDVGMIVLGELVQRLSGERVDSFVRKSIYEPLGMTETMYLPTEELRQRGVPTEKRNGQWMCGEVHDPRAYRLEGVAGHAGLFSTAEDLAVYGQMMLRGGEYEGVRVLADETVKQMTTPQQVPGEILRGLGWDMKSGYSINRGKNFSPQAYGHGGFTGTVFWNDPGNDLTFVFLSSRLHPSGKGNVNRLAGRIGDVIIESIKSPEASAN